MIWLSGYLVNRLFDDIGYLMSDVGCPMSGLRYTPDKSRDTQSPLFLLCKKLSDPDDKMIYLK